MTDTCTYCHGVRLVGWSGAGPILCPECSRDQDAFTVITQAWREQRAAVKELLRENAVLRSNSDLLSSENASLSRQVDAMAQRIESLAEELAKPEDVRLREVIEVLVGRAVVFDSLAQRVDALLVELDDWVSRAGEAQQMCEVARSRLHVVADGMTEHAYQEIASALEALPRPGEANDCSA